MERSPSQKIVAIAGRTSEKVNVFADRFSVPQRYAGDAFAQLIESPDVDAVYVPLPNALHAEWVVRALNAGKHVLCEKPIALRLAELERILEARAASGRVLEENFSYACSPMFEYVRSQLDSGELGRIDSIAVRFSFPATREHETRFNRTLGGGSFLDVGCYGVDFVQRLLEDPIHEDFKIVAEPPGELQKSWGTGPEDPVDAECTFIGRTVSDVDVEIRTRFVGQAQQSIVIAGERGICFIPRAFHMEGRPAFVISERDDGVTSRRFEVFDGDEAMLLRFREKVARSEAPDPGEILRWQRNAKVLETVEASIQQQLSRGRS
jgi:predicted dehydrogenase